MGCRGIQKVLPSGPPFVGFDEEGAYGVVGNGTVGPFFIKASEGFQGRYTLGGVQGQCPWRSLDPISIPLHDGPCA